MPLTLVFLWTSAGLAIAGAPPVTAIEFTPDARQVIAGSQNGLEIWAWPDLKILSRIETELAHVHDIAFSPDGHTLLVGGGSPAETGAVEVLAWPDARRLRTVEDHTDLVYDVAWAPDGTQWATASADGICQVFAADTGKVMVRYEGHSRAVLSICYLGDGKTLVSGGVDQTVQLWDAATGKTLRTLSNHVGTVNSLAVRPGLPADALPVIASASDDRTVRLWQPTIGRLMRFIRLDSAPRVICWSPDGSKLLAGCNDGTLNVIISETVQLIKAVPSRCGRIHAMAVPGSGEVLLAGQSGLDRLEW